MTDQVGPQRTVFIQKALGDDYPAAVNFESEDALLRMSDGEIVSVSAAWVEEQYRGYMQTKGKDHAPSPQLEGRGEGACHGRGAGAGD